MSNTLNPFSNPSSIQTIQAIDQLDLPIMQKHHVRILAHCLAIMKVIYADNSSSNPEDLLREWCNNQSNRFGDKKFSDLFYKQLQSTAKKLNTYSETQGKSIQDLDINDLVMLVEQN